jgi:hypothetical protein
MNPTTIPGANRVFQPPKDWDAERQGVCEPLPVLDTGEFFQAAWLPDGQELACLQAGAPVVVTIWGRSLPPHAVAVMPKPGYVTREAYDAAAAALRNLLFMCRTSREVTRGDDPALLASLTLAESVVGEVAPDARRKDGDAQAFTVQPPQGSTGE